MGFEEKLNFSTARKAIVAANVCGRKISYAFLPVARAHQ